jgi:WD40 repeat protein
MRCDAERTSSSVNLKKKQQKRRFHKMLAYPSLAALCVGSSENEAFMKGCSWSPDGLCLLSSCNDNKLRLYEVPRALGDANESGKVPAVQWLWPSLTMSEGEAIYEFAWNPLMDSRASSTCYFAAASKDKPIHLWDAYTGKVIASFTPLDEVCNLRSALSLRFDASGRVLFAGFERNIQAFDVQHRDVPLFSIKTWLKRDGGQKGLIASLDLNEAGVLAAGCYDKSVALYDDESCVMMLRGHRGGVTSVRFVPNDSNLLLSAARRDNEICLWDIRTGAVLRRFHRECGTNQRVAIDVSACGRFLLSGASDGVLRAYSLQDESACAFLAHPDCANGASFSPNAPLLASCGGERTFQLAEDVRDADEQEEEQPRGPLPRNALALWRHTWTA